MWNLSEFLQRTPTTPIASNGELARQIICWRAHLMKIVAVSYFDDSGTLLTASTDGSVRQVTRELGRCYRLPTYEKLAL